MEDVTSNLWHNTCFFCIILRKNGHMEVVTVGFNTLLTSLCRKLTPQTTLPSSQMHILVLTLKNVCTGRLLRNVTGKSYVPPTDISRNHNILLTTLNLDRRQA